MNSIFNYNYFDWMNNNQGVLSAIVFLLTVMYGWISGTFAALRRKPNLRIRTIDGPTFVCTFGTGAKHSDYAVHRTGVALYLNITNIGASPTSIDTIQIGYKWAIKPISLLWVKYRIGWFWLKHESVIISDFQVKIGENIKFYPFLTQRSVISGDSATKYLEIGQSTNGVVYFEQEGSYGACFPISKNRKTSVKIKIFDSFSKTYIKRVKIPKYSLQQARIYNPSFGLTLSSLREESEPIDLETDHNGNLKPPDLKDGM